MTAASSFRRDLLLRLASAAGVGTLLLAACQRDRGGPPPASAPPPGARCEPMNATPMEQFHCLPPAGGGMCPSIPQAAPALGMAPQQLRCGPVVMVQGGSCCYVGPHRGPTPGRPFVVAGEIVEAKARGGDETRSELARMWTRDALAEHASIASFAQWALELLALGAPLRLLRAAHEAALDEIRHARECFALASRYAGEPIEAAPLEIEEAITISGDLYAFVRATVRDGCVGETASALIADAQLEGATDPEVRRVLRGIRDDEARHAELAWEALAWAFERGGDSLRDAAREAFEEASLFRVEPEGEHGSQRLREHGQLTSGQRAAVIAEAWQSIISPLAERARPSPQPRGQLTAVIS